MNRKALFILTAVALLLVQPRAVSAAAIFDVRVAVPKDTPWSLFFQLIDGSGTGDGNNSVTLSDFNFDGASVVNDASPEGGASGSLDAKTGLILTDSFFFNSFSQTVSGGGLFSFRMSLTNLLDAGGTPDTFAFSLFNDSGALPGSDEFSGAVLIATLNGAGSPGFETFGGLTVTPANPVPEPGTLVLLITGISGAAARKFFRRGAAAR